MSSIGRVAAICLLGLGFAGLSMPVRAQDYSGVTLGFYDRMIAQEAAGRDENQSLNWYLGGVAAAAIYLDVWPGTDSRRTIFCLPDDIQLSIVAVRSLLTDELAKYGEVWRRTPDMPIEQIVVQALAKRYPCQ